MRSLRRDAAGRPYWDGPPDDPSPEAELSRELARIARGESGDAKAARAHYEQVKQQDRVRAREIAAESTGGWRRFP